MNSSGHSAQPMQKTKDIKGNWVSASRFLFYLQLAIGIAFFLGMCYGLYVYRFKKPANIEVPANTHWNPEYK